MLFNEQSPELLRGGSHGLSLAGFMVAVCSKGPILLAGV
jgi:hypothetical protein